jgi:hypothetical protein
MFWQAWLLQITTPTGAGLHDGPKGGESMEHEHLKIDRRGLSKLLADNECPWIAGIDISDLAFILTEYFTAAQAAHEAGLEAARQVNPLTLLQDVKAACKEILSDLEGCPVKMTAKKLEHILAAAAGDLELAAELVNEQVFDALK